MKNRYGYSTEEYDKLVKEAHRIVCEMFKHRTILHCDSCDHEQDSVLGNSCGWCGGKMVEIK